MTRLLLVFVSHLTIFFYIFAQPGRVDLTFNTFDNGERGSGFNGEVMCGVNVGDGGILVGGVFSGFSGTLVNRLVKLNANGQRDPAFGLTGSGFNNVVHAVIPYQGGTWLVGGAFGAYHTVVRRGIARLLPNGELDAGFVPTNTLATNTIIKAIAVQPDGKILIGGDLARTAGNNQRGIIRLESNGTLDVSFGLSTGVNLGADVNAILVQPDGKIVIGGDFNSYNGVTVGRICRLNADGSLDTEFNGGGTRFGTVGIVHALLPQTEGSFLVGGGFDAYNGIESKGIVKLQANGNLHNGFTSPYNGGPIVTCRTLALHPDSSRFFAGGLLGSTGLGKHVALLTASGSIDPGFTAPLLLATVNTVIAQSDGRVFIANGLSAGQVYTNGSIIARPYANMLLPGGAIDASYLQSAGAQSFASGTSGVSAIAVLPDDGVLIGSRGGFSNNEIFRFYNDVGRRTIARLTANGELDLGFNADSGANGSIHDIAVDPASGKAVVVGDFNRFQGQPMQSIVRLLPNGQLDNSFTATGTTLGSGTAIRVVRWLPDGRWLIAGQFKKFNGATAYYLARLTANGALDADFSNQVNVSFSADGVGLLNDIKVLSDGRYLVCGSIGSVSGTGGMARPWVKIFNPDGTPDADFNVSFSTNAGFLNAIESLSDGRVAIAGSFRFSNAPGTVRVAAVLQSNGSLDPNWAGTTRLTGTINRLLANTNGGLFLAGQNITYNDNGTNRTRRGVMLLNSSGAFVPADFTAEPLNEANAGIGKYYTTDADPFVEAMAFQHSGRLIIGGNFQRYGGVLRHSIARVLLGDPDPQGLMQVCAASSFSLEAPITGSSYQWQVNPGTGEWLNLTDNSVYSGVQLQSLQFTNTPTNLYNYQYRCFVDGQPTSIVATLRFQSIWTGAVNNNWSTGGNWSCGIVPDSNTDVILRYGANANVPANTSVRSIRLQQGSQFQTANGVQFQVNQ